MRELFTVSLLWRKMKRIETDEILAESSMIVIEDFVFVGCCIGSEGKDVVSQMEAAFDELERRLKKVDLGLGQVVKMDCLFKDINDLNLLPEVIKKKFGNKYPVRKAYETKFIREGILFQVDALAYHGTF